jgi:hypothetical protein
MLTIDSLARKVAVRVNDSNYSRLDEIKDYLGDLVSDLLTLFRQGMCYQTTTLTIANSEVSMPTDCRVILRVYDSAGILYEVVDNDTFRTRNAAAQNTPTVAVFEDVPSWRIKFLNTPTSGSINVDYLIHSRLAGIVPDYYEALLKDGAVAKYHLLHGTAESASLTKAEYEKTVNKYQELIAYSTPQIRRTKSSEEINFQQCNDYRYSTDNSYMNINRGFY